jgi:5-hydroxyisourate hydrolase
VRLERRAGAGPWQQLATAATDEDGRVSDWLPAATGAEPGHYRLTFATEPHFAQRGVDAFYPEVSVVFRVADPAEHHHVPLLLSPFGYTTYRGS